MAEISSRITERLWLVALIRWVNGMSMLDYHDGLWRPRLAARLQAIDRPELIPPPLGDIKNRFGQGRYHQFLRRTMIKECTDDVRGFSVLSDADRVSGDAWRKMGDAMKELAK